MDGPLNKYVWSGAAVEQRTEEVVVLNAGRRARLWGVVRSCAAVCGVAYHVGFVINLKRCNDRGELPTRVAIHVSKTSALAPQ